MKPKEELRSIIETIAAPNIPVGMDAFYVHALILDHLQALSARMEKLDKDVKELRDKEK